MSPKENEHQPRNDLFTIIDQVAKNPEYEIGADAIRDLTERLIEKRYFPEEVVLNPEEESEIPEDPVYHHLLFDYDANQRTVTLLDGKVIDLTKSENDLLKFLSSRPNEVLDYKEIIKEVWGNPDLYDVQYLRVWISKLYNKMPFWDSENKHSVIKNTLGKGYMFYDPSKKREIVVEREEKKIIEIPQVKEVLMYKHRLFRFTPSLNTVESGDKKAMLSPTHRRFLEALSEAESPYVTREELLELLEKGNYPDIVPDSKIARTHIHFLRKKFKDELGIEEEVIETITGKGYRLLP